MQCEREQRVGGQRVWIQCDRVKECACSVRGGNG